DGFDHTRQITTRAPHVFELLLEERVSLLQLVELLERERIDRTEQAQLAVELTHAAGGGRAFWQFRLLGSFGGCWLDVEVAAKGLDRVLESQLGFCLFDLGAMRLRP